MDLGADRLVLLAEDDDEGSIEEGDDDFGPIFVHADDAQALNEEITKSRQLVSDAMVAVKAALEGLNTLQGRIQIAGPLAFGSGARGEESDVEMTADDDGE